MRDCFGTGRLVSLDGAGYGIEALGLHKPLILTFPHDQPTPDLSHVAGKAILYSGSLPVLGAYGGLVGQDSRNLERLTLTPIELQAFDDDAPITPCIGVVLGNLGKAPEVNPKGDRVGASLAYADNSWLRLAAYPYYSCTDKLKELEAGKRIVVYGQMESYEYKDADRLQLAVQGFGSIAGTGGARKPTVLYSSPSSSHGEIEVADAFSDAA